MEQSSKESSFEGTHQPQSPPLLKKNTQYTNSILKFKLSTKIQQNHAVVEFTQNRVPILQNVADDIFKAKTVGYQMATMGINNGHQLAHPRSHAGAGGQHLALNQQPNDDQRIAMITGKVVVRSGGQQQNAVNSGQPSNTKEVSEQD